MVSEVLQQFACYPKLKHGYAFLSPSAFVLYPALLFELKLKSISVYKDIALD